MSGRLFDLFAYYSLKYKQLDIIEIYNRFLRMINEKEQAEVSTHFPLFLKTGEAARNAPEEIQKILLEQGEKKGS